jgi:hypothetical protein
MAVTPTTIPVPGDNFAGQVLHYALKHVTIAELGDTTVAAMTSTATSVHSLFTFDQPYVWVKELGTRVTEAFYAVTSLTIGDTDAATGWMTSTGMACTAVSAASGPQFKSSIGPVDSAIVDMPAYGNGGKIYTGTGDDIEAFFSLADAVTGDTIGAFDVYVVYQVLPATWPS